MNVDINLFLSINSLAGNNPVADQFFIFCGRYLILLLFIFLIVYIFAYNKKTKKTYDLILAWNAVLAILLGLGFNFILKLICFRPRPFDIGLGENIYGDTITAASFPSEHTMIAFAIATSIFLVHRRFGILAFAIALLVGFSRIAVGVHYPCDVLGGALVGIAMAVFAAQVITPRFLEIKNRKKKKKKI